MTNSNAIWDEAQDQNAFLKGCMRATYEAVLVCDLLEALADDLPQRVAPVWREAQGRCRKVLGGYFGTLDAAIYPAMLRQHAAPVGRVELLNRLNRDCTEQIHALSELDAIMTEAFQTRKLGSEPEALGFALRGFFEALRRDLKWHMDVLWPLAARNMPDRTRAEILTALRTVAVMH